MFLTGEGALLAVALAGLVVGLLGAWAVLRVAVKRPETKAPAKGSKPGELRRVIVPEGTAPKV
jgi:hypothetical protein